MGVSPSAFRKWLKGEAEPSRERLVALARTAGGGVAGLATGEGPEPSFRRAGAVPDEPLSQASFDPKRYVIPPRFQEAAMAGSPGAEPVVEVADHGPRIAFEREWLRERMNLDPESLALEIAQGDSMDPTISDGDQLLIDLADRHLREFGVYVLVYEDARLIKRVQRKLDHSVLLISDNPIYESERLAGDAARQLEVVGRVIWRGGRI